MSATTTPKFTLRFRNQRNHQILSLLAERFGMSKNQLAEDMLDRELQAAALLLESDLTCRAVGDRGQRRPARRPNRRHGSAVAS